MNATPKTIQIFLPGGDPRGIRVAEVTTRIVQAIEVPRPLLDQFLTMPESNQVGLYFLFSETEDGTERRVYIGQTSDLASRLTTHNKQKDFWDRAVILVSRTNSLTQTHALYLEWHSIQTAKKAARFIIENGTGGTKPHTPAPLEADCLEILETAHWLLSTLGFQLFDPVAGSKTSQPQEILYCQYSDSNGRGVYTEEGFVVLKGSKGRKVSVASFVGTTDEKARLALIEKGILKEEGDHLVFTKDHLFKTPSGAAMALMGRTANGWITWKNEAGKTLDELKRHSVAG